MLVVAFWSALAIALLTLVTAIVKAALEASQDDVAKAESLSFVRLTLTGIFGVVVGEAFTPLGLAWWWSASIATGLMFILLFGSQIASRGLGHLIVGRKLSKALMPLVNSLHLLFTPLSLPKIDEPEEFEQELLDSVEDFGETIVREIMVPRVDMATVAGDSTLAEAMQVLLARGYSRVPVTGKNIDDIVGVLYLKDTARALYEQRVDFAVTEAAALVRPPVFVPESMPVEALLQQLQTTNRHIAIVVDEYGGVAGLVTLEDVIEELVGEISDEFDRDVADVTPLGDGSYRINARFALFELGELFGLELEDEDVDSVGGLLTKELERLPRKGDSVTYSGLVFTADRIEGRRKRLITVLVQASAPLSESQEAFE